MNYHWQQQAIIEDLEKEIKELDIKAAKLSNYIRFGAPYETRDMYVCEVVDCYEIYDRDMDHTLCNECCFWHCPKCAEELLHPIEDGVHDFAVCDDCLDSVCKHCMKSFRSLINT